MSPLGSPCPRLVVIGDIYICGDYENRPEECSSHRFPFRHCPIGVDGLALETTYMISQRIDKVWELIKAGAAKTGERPYCSAEDRPPNKPQHETALKND